MWNLYEEYNIRLEFLKMDIFPKIYMCDMCEIEKYRNHYIKFVLNATATVPHRGLTRPV